VLGDPGKDAFHRLYDSVGAYLSASKRPRDHRMASRHADISACRSVTKPFGYIVIESDAKMNYYQNWGEIR
jgi:hypothetical protein